MLPASYIRFGYGSLATFFVSLVILIMEFPMFAWTLFMICFASLGMFVVVVLACIEYRNNVRRMK